MIARELITKLGFKVDDSSFRRAQSSILNLKNGILALGTALTAGFIAKSFRDAANELDSFVKQSQKIGISVEALQRLSYAASLGDVSMETLSTGIGLLSKNVFEFANGSKEAAEAFAQIQIDPSKFKDTEQLFLALSERFKELPDGAKKTALAMKIFGRSGKELIPLLNAGSEEIKKQGEELQILGGVFSIDGAKAAEAFNDNLTRMGAFFKALRNSIAVRFFPVFNELIDKFLQWLKVNKDIVRARINDAIKLTARAFELLGIAFKFVYNTAKDIWEFLKQNPTLMKMATVGVIALTAVMYPLMTALAGVLLLFDDWKTWMEGGPSLFGDFYASVKQFADDLNLIFEHDIKPIFDFFNENKWVLNLSPIILFKNIVEEIKNIFATIEKILDRIFGKFQFFQNIKSTFSSIGDFFDSVEKTSRNLVGDAAKTSIIPGYGLYKGITDRAAQIRATPEGQQIRGVTNQNNQKIDLKINSPINVNVTTDADPSKIADDVRKVFTDKISQVLKDTLYDMQPGEVGIA